MASLSNAILNTPNTLILNTWVAWLTQLGKLRRVFQPAVTP